MDPEFEFDIKPNAKGKVENKFIDSIIKLANDLDKSKCDFKLPEWCSDYYLPGELHNFDKLKKLEIKSKEINLKIIEQRRIIDSMQKAKVLFTGDGTTLELEVARIFRELGFNVAKGLPGRDDLIMSYGDKVALVEVKGVSKSAAESHASQLEKWVSEYKLQHGITAKGILVINTFKEIPLKDRTQMAFPDQMVPYSKKRDHCLITGVQLLGFYLDCKNNIPKKKKWSGSYLKQSASLKNIKIGLNT